MSSNHTNLNLKQVAQQLGVSTATVSNAFNRPDQLSAKLREHILSESAKLGYHGPNLAARSLRRGKSGVIGVILADSLSYSFSDPMASQLLQGVADVLAENQKQLLLLSSELQSAEQSSAESLPDGFIFYGAPMGNTYERVLRLGKPIVAVDFEPENVAALNIDNQHAAYKIASHALTDDVSQVAVVGMRLVRSERVCRLLAKDLEASSEEIARARLLGFMQAATERELPLKPNQIWHIPINSTDMAEVAAHELLTTNPRPQAVLCMSDVIALAVMKVARELDISVPHEVKVTGFDDIPEASRSNPSLTTVCQQSREKGRLAASMLLSNDTRSHQLETRLMVRQSC